MTGCFMLITNDGHSISTGRKISAYEIALHRSQQGVWPLYSGTRYRGTITAGDQVLFCVAGEKEHRQSFVASACVASVDYPKRTSVHIDNLDLNTGEPFRILKLRAVD